KVSDLVTPSDFDQYTRIALANAVRMRGTWESPFEPSATSRDDFTLTDGTSVRTPTMHATVVTDYAEGPDYQAAVLRYGGKPAVSMLVVLPAPGRFDAFEQAFDGARLSAVASGFEQRIVDVALPKFDVGYRVDLAKALQPLGLNTVFSGVGTDFSPMA